METARKLLRRLIVWLGGPLAVLGLAYLFLLRTTTGHDFLLERALGYLEGRIDGEVRVDGIRSAGLLRGLTLRGVTVEGPEGRPFLQADSLLARYSLSGLIRGDLSFSRIELWRPRVVLERLPGDDRLNVEKIFRVGGKEAGAPADTGDGGGGTRLDFRSVGIHDGDVAILLPFDGDSLAPGSRVEPGPKGGLLARTAFHEIQGRFPRIRIGPPGGPDEEVRIEELSLEALVVERPIRLRDFRGRVQRMGSRVSFQADRLWLPESEFAGDGWVDWGDPAGIAAWADLEGHAVRLADLRWIEPRLPDAGGAFDVRLAVDPGVARVRLAPLDVILDRSRIRGELGLRIGDGGVRLEDTELLPEPFELRHLDPWLEEPLPVQGRVRGRLRLDGPLGALVTRGRLSLEADPAIGGPESVAQIDGILHLDGRRGVTDLSLVLDPFEFGLAARVDPRVALRGPGTVDLTVDGTMGETLRFDARVTHRPQGLPSSSVRFRGTARGGEDALELDVVGRLEPLSLTALQRAYPEVPFTGQTSGTVELRGPVSDLGVRVRLSTLGGPLALSGRFDVRNPRAGYSLEGDLEDFELSSLYPRVPGPTRLTGRLRVEGEGFALDSISGSATVELGSSQVGHLRVDTVTARLRVDRGTLRVDTVLARTSVADLEGTGTLGVADSVPDGRVSLLVTSDSLEGVRPFLLGDTVIARDTLSDIERNILELEGVDLEALPDTASVAMSGRLRGSLDLEGSVREFGATGRLRVEEVRYGDAFLRGADVDFVAEGLPGLGRRMDVTLTTDSVVVGERRFAGSDLHLIYGEGEGDVDIVLRRSEAEDYRTRATFRIDSLGGDVRLEELTLRFEPVLWTLAEDATISWSEDGIQVRDFRLIRPDEEHLRIAAEGTLPFRGPADFRLEVDSLRIGRLGQLAQFEREVEGTLALRLRITGEARAPVMDGTLSLRDLQYDSVDFSLVQGGIRYRDERITVGLLASVGPSVALTIDGFLPANLAFQAVEQRIPDEEMDLRIRADSLPASQVLGFLESLERVEGVVDGRIQVAGTLTEPSPSGTMNLRGGAVTLEALGVRYAGVDGTFQLQPDGVVRVDATARSGGTFGVQGTVTLDPATDPALDLRISTRDFQAVNRRDVTARIGGQVTLQGTYRRPLLQGGLRVDQGVLFLEEFSRSADVVDLSDPAFFDVVDTSLVAVRPLLAESQNPFLSNLRVDVDLAVQRDTWIRGPDINVELQGGLTVVYDRTSRDLALVGELQAVRGSYSAFGRRFQVQQGSVEFVGTPGLDPSLDIQAATRLRRPNQEPLNILANVEGTLSNPRVTLSSDAQPPIPQSDLVGYLVFGRPTSLLGPGERSVAGGGASEILGGIASAGASLGLGTLTSQLSSAVTQEIGFFDYFAITTGQEQSPTGDGAAVGGLSSTQIEFGRYISEDLFLAVLLRPLAGTGREAIPGVRLEWRFTDSWTIEGFAEDRFARTPGGFGDLSLQPPEQIFGFSLFREWGY